MIVESFYKYQKNIVNGTVILVAGKDVLYEGDMRERKIPEYLMDIKIKEILIENSTLIVELELDEGEAIKYFTDMLYGRECGNEITEEEINIAKKLGYVVVFGYSEECIEFRGAINDEIYCSGGRKIIINKNGVTPICECKSCRYYEDHEIKKLTIEAIWCSGEYTWEYKTEIQHETFNIYEDGVLFTKGIVFNLNEL